MSPEDRKHIENIAADLGVDESLIEKDWHAMHLVAVLAGIQYSEFEPVFSGGTSLSKGFGLIKRFSEDLDFKIKLPSDKVTRAQRSSYRQHIVDAIRATGFGWTLNDDDIMGGNQSRYFLCKIGYEYTFKPVLAVRPHLKLEMSFTSPALPYETKSLRSFLAQTKGESPEVNAIACVSPIETAADKLSALVWRVLSRERGTEGDDPALIRHLHDLAALESLVIDSTVFNGLVRELFVKDAERGKLKEKYRRLDKTGRIKEALRILETDKEYAAEYVRFVDGVSYALANEQRTFDDALQALQRIVSLRWTPMFGQKVA